MPVERATRSWLPDGFFHGVLDGQRNGIGKVFLREGGVNIDRKMLLPFDIHEAPPPFARDRRWRVGGEPGPDLHFHLRSHPKRLKEARSAYAKVLQDEAEGSVKMLDDVRVLLGCLPAQVSGQAFTLDLGTRDLHMDIAITDCWSAPLVGTHVLGYRGTSMNEDVGGFYR
jgi:hypothetical protein